MRQTTERHVISGDLLLLLLKRALRGRFFLLQMRVAKLHERQK